MFKLLFRLCILCVLGASSGAFALHSSLGTPLGGLGAGYVVYNAKTGNFAAVTKVSPAGSLGSDEWTGGYKSTSSGFHLFAGSASKMNATTTDETARIPIYAANFGTVGGVVFSDTNFSPTISGAAYEQLAHSPVAFFDITATNTTNAAQTVAVALEFSNVSSKNNLLGGKNVGTFDGPNGLAWADSNNSNGYLMVNCDVPGATYQGGPIGTFSTNGTLGSGPGNVLSAKVSLAAGAVAHFRFVMSWYSIWQLTPANAAKPGTEGRWYQNYYGDAVTSSTKGGVAGSKVAATYAMSMYDKARANAISMVSRVMASNFPDWYKDRLLNNCYTMCHNSFAAYDGRSGIWEGQYSILGTIDQSEHGGLWYVWNFPQFEWRETQFWARSQHQEPNLIGQCHHDFNGTTSASTWSYGNGDVNHFLFPWDNYSHDDYSWQPNTTDWSDLNSMFIFKAYELMMATGCKDSLLKILPGSQISIWSAVKRAGQRIINQCPAGHYVPTTAKCTYDSDNSTDPPYNCGLALPSWLAIIEMAKWIGEDSTVAKFKAQYDLARTDYANTFVNVTGYVSSDLRSNSDAAGYDWARYLNLGIGTTSTDKSGIFDSALAANACNTGYKYFKSQPGFNKLGQWHFYGADHLGGFFIACNRPDTSMWLHKMDYDNFYGNDGSASNSVAGTTFWQDLWGTTTTHNSYCTAPCVWRSYVQFTGVTLDRANHRLWIRPTLPTNMGKVLTNAPIITPYGWGTINYNEHVRPDTIQSMTVTFDSVTKIRELVLKNNYVGDSANPHVFVQNNGTPVAVSESFEGSGFEKIIRVTFPDSIPVQAGLTVQVRGHGVPTHGQTWRPVGQFSLDQLGNIGKGKVITYSIPAAGKVSVDLFSLSGAKLGTIYKGSAIAGKNSFVWDGKSTNGQHLGTSSAAVLKLSTSAGTISKLVIIGR